VNVLRGLSALAIPAAILAVAGMLSAYADALPSAHAALLEFLPAIALALGILLAIAFQRGRVLFALLTLGAAWLVYRGYLGRGVTGSTARAVFMSLCLLVPVNLAALALTRERGIFNGHGLLRAAVLAIECGAAALLVTSGPRELVYWLHQPLMPEWSTGTRLPQIALLLTVVCFFIGIGTWWRSRSAIDLAFSAVLLAWVVAAQYPPPSAPHLLFIGAGALILAASLLQDAYRMAFRDELTGVPGRRALNEHLARLGRRYVIAVLDIDHFKKFNDTHGHDVGDQVLKMVASRIERVHGGGSAYRYGGEEFVIVFPGAGATQSLPHLEALRVDVARHGLTLRAAERPSKTPARARAPARKPRATAAGGKKLSVTISIGVAERSEKFATPAAVLTAADQALYRAKRAGRNRVSR